MLFKDLSQALMLLIINKNPSLQFSSLFLSIQNQSEKIELFQTGDEMRSQDESSSTQGKNKPRDQTSFLTQIAPGGGSFSPSSQFPFPVP